MFDAYGDSIAILRAHRAAFEEVARQLKEREELTGDEVRGIVSSHPPSAEWTAWLAQRAQQPEGKTTITGAFVQEDKAPESPIPTLAAK